MAKIEPIPGKLVAATDGTKNGPMAVAVEIDGKFQPLGYVSFDEAHVIKDNTIGPGGEVNHQHPGAVASFADAAKLTTSISFATHDISPTTLGLYWGVPEQSTPENLMPAYTGEASLAPADQVDGPAPFPKPSLDGLVKPPTAAQKKMLDGVQLSAEEVEETTTPLLTDALIKQSLKENFLLAPGWADAGYIPDPLKWDDLVAAFEPVKAGVKKMHVAIESTVKSFQEIMAKHTKAIAAAYDNGGLLPSSQNPFASTSAPVDVDSNSGRAVSLRRMIPGINDVVKLPCFHGGTNSVWLAIQHLNDYHNPNDGDREPWSREAIADWLETLDADLRVADAPVIRERDWVRGRISRAVAYVLMTNSDGTVRVEWKRSGLISDVHPRDLVLIQEPSVPKKPASPSPYPPANKTWQFGDVVKDPKTGLTGTIVEVKTFHTALVEPDIIELKIAFVPPVGTVIMPASAVQKVEPKVAAYEIEMELDGHTLKHTAAVADWPPEIILDEPMMPWMSYGADSWQVTPELAHGKKLGDVVHLPQGAGRICGYDHATDLFRVLLNSGQTLVVLPQVIEAAKELAPPPETTSWKAEAAKKLASPISKAKLLLELTGSAQPPLGLADTVRLANDPSTLEGKVVQYQVDSNTDPMNITYTVQWGPGGPTSTNHSRDELVLVEAYKPPSDEPIIDWGSKKITAIHPNIY